jgi:hypothetical protein
MPEWMGFCEPFIRRHRNVPPSINQMARPKIVRCPLLGARARTFTASSADKQTHD